MTRWAGNQSGTSDPETGALHHHGGQPRAVVAVRLINTRLRLQLTGICRVSPGDFELMSEVALMDLDISELDGRRLPQPGRIITRHRDVAIIDLPSADKPKLTCTRTAVVFSEDTQADPRIYDILLAFHYRAFKHRVNLIGLAKVRHSDGPALRWWYGSVFDAKDAARELNDSARAALWPAPSWTVEQPILVTMKEGLLDRDRLKPDDLLRVVPERYKLGLATP